MIDILSLYRPETQSAISDGKYPGSEKELEATWTHYCGVVYDVYRRIGGDVVFQKRLALQLWPLFMKPVTNGDVSFHELRTLLARFRDALRTDTTMDKMFSLSASSSTMSRAFDFPAYTNYLLIAAYLASFNPQRLDVRYFSRSREERTRKTSARKSSKKQDTLLKQLKAPKLFEFERMLAIFQSILPDDINMTSDIHSQIATLLSLKLLTRVTTTDILDSAGKWRANVTEDQIRRICDRVHFKLGDFLHA